MLGVTACCHVLPYPLCLVPRMSQQYYMEVSSWMIEMESSASPQAKGKQRDTQREEVAARASLFINVSGRYDLGRRDMV